MKKTYGKLKSVLLVVLSLALVFSMTFALGTSFAETTTTTQQTANESDSLFEVAYDAETNHLTLLADASIGNYRELTKADLAALKNDVLHAIKALIEDQILNNGLGDEIRPMTIAAGNLDESIFGNYREYLENRLKNADELDKYLSGEYDALIKHVASSYLEKYLAKHPEAELETVMDKVQAEVINIVNEAIDYVYSEDGPYSDLPEFVREQFKQNAQETNEAKMGAIAKDIKSNGTSTLTIEDLIKSFRGVAVDGLVIFENSDFVDANIKQLIIELYGKIANMNGNYQFNYHVNVDLSFGEIICDLTIGLKGDTTQIQKAIAFAKQYVSFDRVDGVFTLTVEVPEGFSSLLLKLANTKHIPDNIKHAAFGLLDKTASEIWDKASEYEIDQILGYIKGHDFQKVFDNLLNAEYIYNFFGSYGSYLDKLPQDKIEKLIDKTLEYATKLAGKVASKEDVAELEKVLQSYGIPGIPAQLEGAVQKFINLLNRFDVANWDRAKIVDFLKNRSNSKIDAFIQRLMDSSKVERVYELACQYIDRLVNKLDDTRFADVTIAGMFADGALTWSGNIDFNLANYDGYVQRIVNRILEAIGKDSNAYLEEAIRFVESHLHFNVDVKLSANLPNVHKVTYITDEDTSVGLLPEGADLWFFANTTTVNGLEIIAWVDQNDIVYYQGDKMPDHDVELTAITAIEADIEKGIYSYEQVYGDGEIVITAIITKGNANGSYSYQWYKDGVALEGETEASITLVNVADSGVYYCLVTTRGGLLSDETPEVTVEINPYEIDLSEIELDETSLVYNAAEQSVELKGEIALPEGAVAELVYAIEGDFAATIVGEYTITFALIDDANYTVKEEKAWTWNIAPYEINLGGVAVENKVYNATEQSVLTLEDLVDLLPAAADVDEVFEIEGATQQNAGDYTVTITLLDAHNYVLTGAEIIDNVASWDWEISKYVIDLTELELSGELEVTYDATAQTVTLEGAIVLPDGVDVDDVYVIEGEYTATNVGKYPITFKLVDTDNYEVEGETSWAWEITPYEIDLTSVALDETSLVYNAAEQSVALGEIKLPEAAIAANVYEIKGDLAGTNVKEYAVIFELLDNVNYTVEGETSWTWAITPYEIDLTGVALDKTSLVYNAAEQSVALSAIALPKAAIAANVYEIKGDLAGTNVKEYAVIFELLDNVNYTVKGDNTWTWAITPYEIDFSQITLNKTEFVYNAANQSVKFKGTINLPKAAKAESVYAIAGDFAATNVGDYTITITLKDTINYVLAEASNVTGNVATLTWTINPYEIDLTGVALDKTSLVYNAAEQSVTLSAIALPKAAIAANVYEIKGDLVGTNVKEYTVIFELLDNVNYTVKGDNTWTWAITPYEIDLTGVALDKTSLVYNAAEQSVALSAIALPKAAIAANVYEIKGDLAGTNAKTYTVTFKLIDDVNYTVKGDDTWTWNITKYVIDLSEVALSKTTFEFDATVHSVTLGEIKLPTAAVAANVYSLSEDKLSGTHAGTYTVTFTLIDNVNYTVEGEASWTWTITKKVITLVNEWNYNGALRYNGQEQSVTLKNLPADVEKYLEYVDNKATAINTYTAKVVVKAEYKDDCELSEAISLNWAIIKGQIDLNGAKLENNSFVYTGSEIAVKLVNVDLSKALPSGVELAYTGTWSATNVGSYKATLGLKGAEAANYELITTYEWTWEITKAELGIDFSAITLKQAMFEYNGSAITVELSVDLGSMLPAGITWAFSGIFEATEIGKYSVTIVLSGDALANYETPVIPSWNWEITKITIDLNNAEWNYDAAIKYDGNEHAVVLKNIDESVAALLSYTENTATARGHYTAQVTVKDDAHYQIVGLASATLEWEITFGEVDLNGATLEQNKFEYTGSAITVVLTNVDLSKALPNGVELAYNGDWSATEVGTYTATIGLKGEEAENYKLVRSYSFTWEITKAEDPIVDPNAPVNPNGERGHEFTYTIPGTNIKIIVIDVEGAVDVSASIVASVTDAKVKAYKDILKGQLDKGKKAKLVLDLDIAFANDYASQAGNHEFDVKISADELNGLDASILRIVHTHGSQQIVLTATSETINGDEYVVFTTNGFSTFGIVNQAPNLWWVWLLIAIIILLIIIIILLLVLRNRNEETDEEVVEEEPAPEEEPVISPFDLPVATAVEEDHTPIAIPVSFNGERTIVDRSFTARLSRSSDELKEMYSDLKNDILAYKKIRSRVSWKFDSFYKGRAKCVILQIRGKKINMYIALRAEDLAPKYHAKDVSDKKRYENVPTLVKIRGTRSLKYAKQLVAQVMNNMGVQRGELANVNYKLRYRSEKALFNDGLIKYKTIRSSFIDSQDDTEENNQ